MAPWKRRAAASSKHINYREIASSGTSRGLFMFTLIIDDVWRKPAIQDEWNRPKEADKMYASIMVYKYE